MAIVFPGNHLFEHELFFGLVGFGSEFRRVRVTREAPDLVSGIFDQGGPEEVATLFAVHEKLAES